MVGVQARVDEAGGSSEGCSLVRDRADASMVDGIDIHAGRIYHRAEGSVQGSSPLWF